MEIQTEQKNTVRTIFLEALKKSGIIERACKEAVISRTTFYRWVDNDSEFGVLVFESMHEAYEVNWEEMDRIPKHKRNSFLRLII